MNMMKLVLCLNLLCAASSSMAVDIVGQLQEGKKLFPTEVEKREHQLQELKDKYSSFQQQQEDLDTSLLTRGQDYAAHWQAVTNTLETSPEDEFSHKMQLLLDAWNRCSYEMRSVSEKDGKELDEHIQVLTSYVQDPDLRTYQEKLGVLPPRDTYTLEELQRLNIEKADLESKIEDLKKESKNAKLALDDVKLTAADTVESVEKRKRTREQLQVGQVGTLPELFGLNEEQRNQLFALEDRVQQDQELLNSYRMTEIQHKISLLDTQLFVERQKLHVVERSIMQVKSLISITEESVERAKIELAEKERRWVNKNNVFAREISKLRALKKEQLRILQEHSKAYNIPLGPDLDNWTREPKQTIPLYMAFLLVSDLNSNVLQIDRMIEHFEVQQEFAREEFDLEKIKTEVKESYYWITSHRFVSEDAIAQETKHYDRIRLQAKLKLSSAQNKKDIIDSNFTTQNKILVKIQELRQAIIDSKNGLFKNNANEFRQCLTWLSDAEKKVNAQRRNLSEMLVEHSKMINVIREKIQQVNFILGEIEAHTFWYRTEYAISVEGFKGIGADIRHFVGYVAGIFTRLHPVTVYHYIKHAGHSPLQILFFLFNVLLCIALLFFVRKMMPLLSAMCDSYAARLTGLSRTVCLWLGVLVRFTQEHFVLFGGWLLVWALSLFYLAQEPNLLILLNLFSIPYALYLAHTFMRTFIDFNIGHDYAILSHEFERRCTLVCSILLYINTVIFFFRNAFVLSEHLRSELPAILVAASFISLQVALIFLITKDQLLSIIPTRNDFWKWLHEQVDTYYYPLLLLLITIIVMSNPYVGFGRLVFYLMSHVVYTIILLRGIFALHLFVKKMAARLFFSIKDEAMQERFGHAKTWYGLFVIAVFAFFTAVGCLLVAKIWGWPESLSSLSTWKDLKALLNIPLVGEGPKSVISVAVILKIIGMLFVGFLVSIFINRFVLGRIFDVLLVEAGVQNAVSSIMRYLILLLTVLFAFQAVGLGDLINYMFVALLGIGYLIKEPLSDFVAYFIILVQRPIKIGDYIFVRDGVQGVVRKITPRSVVLRRKNSTTVVVPNTEMINHPLTNWNYVRNFVAFDDIIITVYYKEDAEKVRDLLFQVVESYPRILKNPKPVIRLDDFTERGMLFMVRGYVSSNYTLDMWDIASDIRINILKTLRANGIEIALPSRVVVEDGRYKFVDSSDVKKID